MLTVDMPHWISLHVYGSSWLVGWLVGWMVGGHAALDQPARVRQQLVDWLVGWLVERVGSSATQFMSHQSAMINKRAHQYVKRTKSLNGENTTIDLNRSVAPSV